MAKYTIELNTLLRNEKFNTFDFEYDFYDKDLKPIFEMKFNDYYRFHEIGFETVERFQHNLKAKLNLIMPYYSELYRTQLEAKNINFLLNKDLKETFIRDIQGSDTSNNVSSTVAKSDSISKESYLDNGNADLSLTDGLTGVSSNGSTGDTQSKSDSTANNKSTEKTELISQGNIGITSSAELLQKWRDTIINIDKMIIEECKDLFMQIY